MLLTGCDQMDDRVRQRGESPRVIRIIGIWSTGRADGVLLDGAHRSYRERSVAAA